MAIYRGFSTTGVKNGNFSVTDVELIKTDILNEFNTKRGERLMLPRYGSIIHELIMDPLDGVTKSLILEDVNVVISHEPRVRLIGEPKLIELDYTIRIEITLLFLPNNTSPEKLIVEFNRTISEGI